jgi:hypothetical protein
MAITTKNNLIVDNDLELDLELDIGFIKPLRSTSSSKNAKNKKASKRPRKPQPWDDDWYDPEDFL